MALAPFVEWQLKRPINSDNVSITLQEHLSEGQLLNFSRFTAFFPATKTWKAALPADAAIPGGPLEAPGTLVSLGHKRI
eukprot:COSAG06_NODE_34601_length_472_cov_0.981233_1_plen_79_part_00